MLYQPFSFCLGGTISQVEVWTDFVNVWGWFHSIKIDMAKAKGFAITQGIAYKY
jgi:hypothetical protein